MDVNEYFKRFDRFAEESRDDHEAWLDDFMQDQLDNIVVAGFFPHPEAGTTMLHIMAGFGDGVYPVRRLIENGRPVGAEVVFLQPGQGYFEETHDPYDET